MSAPEELCRIEAALGIQQHRQEHGGQDDGAELDNDHGTEVSADEHHRERPGRASDPAAGAERRPVVRRAA